MVCVAESLFVQVTVVPALTVKVDGENAKLATVTELPVAAAAGVVEGAVEFGVLLPEEHAESETRATQIKMTDIIDRDRFKTLFMIYLPSFFVIQDFAWCLSREILRMFCTSNNSLRPPPAPAQLP
jgi:hypothetical protein